MVLKWFGAKTNCLNKNGNFTFKCPETGTIEYTIKFNTYSGHLNLVKVIINVQYN